MNNKIPSSAAYIIPGLIRGRLNESIIIKEVCKYYDVPQDMVFAKYKQMNSHIRHITIYFMKNLLGWSYPMLGRHLNLHHTSALRSVQFVTEQIIAKHDNIYKQDVPIIKMIFYHYKK